MGMRGHTCIWSMFFWAKDWLHWPHFIRLISPFSDKLKRFSSSQSSMRMRSSFMGKAGSELWRARPERTQVSTVVTGLLEATGIGALWCHDRWVSFVAVGGGLSTLSLVLGDLREDDLVGACVVTAGWVETGTGNWDVVFSLSVGWIWPWAARTSCRSLVPNYVSSSPFWHTVGVYKRHVLHFQWDSHILRIFFIVPYEKFGSHRNLPKSSIIDIPTVLKRKQILFLSVASTANKPHPAGSVFVTSIEVMRQLSLLIDLPHVWSVSSGFYLIAFHKFSFIGTNPSAYRDVLLCAYSATCPWNTRHAKLDFFWKRGYCVTQLNRLVLAWHMKFSWRMGSFVLCTITLFWTAGVAICGFLKSVSISLICFPLAFKCLDVYKLWFVMSI